MIKTAREMDETRNVETTCGKDQGMSEKKRMVALDDVLRYLDDAINDLDDLYDRYNLYDAEHAYDVGLAVLRDYNNNMMYRVRAQIAKHEQDDFCFVGLQATKRC